MHVQLGTSAGESSSLGNSPYAGVGARDLFHGRLKGEAF